MAVVEVTVIPIGTKDPSLSKYVAKALEELENKDVDYELTPSGTVLEGDLSEILEVIRDMHESVFGDDIKRVVTSVQIDDRRDKKHTRAGKKKSVEDRMKK